MRRTIFAMLGAATLVGGAAFYAQTHAVGFYARQGFEAIGEEFLEAGIPHYAMVRKLKPG